MSPLQVQLRSVVDDYLEEKRGGEGVAMVSANKGPLLAALQTFVHSHELKVTEVEEAREQPARDKRLEKWRPARQAGSVARRGWAACGGWDGMSQNAWGTR